MSNLSYSGAIQAPNLLLGAGKSSLTISSADGEDFLIVENSLTGQHSVFGLQSSLSASQLGVPTGFQVVGTKSDLSGAQTNHICFDPLTQGMGEFSINADGSYSAITPYTFEGGQPFDVASATICGSGPDAILIVAQSEGPGLLCYQMGPAGTYVQTDYNDLIGQTEYNEGLVQLTTVTVAGEEYVLSVSQGGNGVTILKPQSDGTITVTSELGVAQGLGVNAPAEVETVTLGDATYVLMAATNTSSISVARLLENGSLIVTDHVIDSLDTRMENLTGLEIVSVNGRVLVLTAGSDGGVTGLELLPSGKLTHVFSTGDDNVAGLGNVTSLAAKVVGDEIQVFALSENSASVAQFSYDLTDFGPAINGTAGVDNLIGNATNDLLAGGLGDDTLEGGDGNDVILDGDGSDVMIGGAGSDTFVISADGETDTIMDFNVAEDLLDLSETPQIYSVHDLDLVPTATGARLTIGGQVLELFSHDGNAITISDLPFSSYTKLTHIPSVTDWVSDVITGDAADNVIEGTEVDDVILGEGGADILDGLAGNDEMRGGEGDDTLDGGIGDDEIYGEGGNDLLRGGLTGNDQIFGGDGNDVAEGGSDQDLLEMGTGWDTAHGGDGDDVIDGEHGFDELHGEAGNDTIFGGNGEDRLVGGVGDDFLFGEADNDLLQGNEGNDWLFGGGGDDRIETGEGHDTVDGGTGDDLVFAADGNDVIRGGEGNDTIHGQDGDDDLHGGNQDDLVNGGNGNDRMEGGHGNDTMSGDEGDDRLFGGPSGQDNLSGGAGVDRLFGQDGADTLDGGADGDFLYGGTGNDQINGADGNDIARGGDGDDVITGGIGFDALYGEHGDDTIDGGNGSDIINAGAGSNVVSGGNGIDTFVFGPTDFENTRIIDFLSDMIDLSAVSSIENWEDLTENHLSEVGADLHITFDNSTVVLQNTSMSEVARELFVF